MMGLWPSFTTVTSTPVATQSLHWIDVLFTPIILIKSLEKLYKSCISGDCTQKLSLHSDTTVVARLLLIIVHTLPESIKAFFFVFPIQMSKFYWLHFSSVAFNRNFSNTVVIVVIKIPIGICIIDALFSEQSIYMIDLLSNCYWSTHRGRLEDIIVYVVYSGLRLIWFFRFPANSRDVVSNTTIFIILPTTRTILSMWHP